MAEMSKRKNYDDLLVPLWDGLLGDENMRIVSGRQFPMKKITSGKMAIEYTDISGGEELWRAVFKTLGTKKLKPFVFESFFTNELVKSPTDVCVAVHVELPEGANTDLLMDYAMGFRIHAKEGRSEYFLSLVNGIKFSKISDNLCKLELSIDKRYYNALQKLYQMNTDKTKEVSIEEAVEMLIKVHKERLEGL